MMKCSMKLNVSWTHGYMIPSVYKSENSSKVCTQTVWQNACQAKILKRKLYIEKKERKKLGKIDLNQRKSFKF